MGIRGLKGRGKTYGKLMDSGLNFVLNQVANYEVKMSARTAPLLSKRYLDACSGSHPQVPLLT